MLLHLKHIAIFVLEIIVVFLGIKLVEIHLGLSCLAILFVMAFNTIKFLHWYKNRNNKKDG